MVELFRIFLFLIRDFEFEFFKMKKENPIENIVREIRNIMCEFKIKFKTNKISSEKNISQSFPTIFNVSVQFALQLDNQIMFSKIYVL